jgi:hypothetical protein
VERSRHSIGRRITLVAAVLGCSQAAQATNSVRTAASAEIQDAAGVTIVDDVPLQLLLTSGVPTAFMFTVAPAQSGSPASTNLGIRSVPIDVNGSGFVAGVTDTGEILSVSVASGEDSAAPGSDGSAAQNVRTVIAQFN